MKHFAAAALALLASTLEAATFHVAISGNDAGNGLSMVTAWATLQHGADEAVAGDSVLVHPGSYQGFAAMDNSGAAGAPIVFLATGPGVNITSPCPYNNLDGINVEGVNWVVVEGFTVNDMPRTGIRTVLSDHVTIRYNSCNSNYKWGILTGFAEHVTVEHNSCSGSEDEHGIYVSNSADDPIIRFNHCFDNNANGIHMNGDVSLGGDGIISSAQVYGNTIHGNGVAGGSGINCDGVVNSVFFNNLLYDNHASGISLYQIDGGAPSTGNKVYNNTIINASDARWCVNITDDCTGNQLLNNILINQHAWRGSIVVAASALAGFVSDFNLVTDRLSPDGDATILDLAAWQALGFDANSMVASPQASLFSIPGSDFHPLSAAAQMVDAGTAAVSAVVDSDIEGTPRPLGSGFDIGCYENDLGTAITGALSQGEDYRFDGTHFLLPDDRKATLVLFFSTDGRLMARRNLNGSARVEALSTGAGVAVFRNAEDATVGVVKWCSR
ncbi:MAG: right-handed parallel beta-helix repeat-containing protein [Flavobacteriales bacterium]|nr:MAG: right-handed parallel beta-helix repeat-containing protein [Flavobacteriales bacterium]